MPEVTQSTVNITTAQPDDSYETDYDTDDDILMQNLCVCADSM